MKFIKKIYLLFILQLFVCSLVAAPADSVSKYGPNTVRFLQLSQQNTDSLKFDSLDTDYIGFQNFHPATRTNIPFLNLGNLGIATAPIFYESNVNTGFQDGWISLNNYLATAEKIKFYRTASPFTQLKYFWNQKQEQLFSFTFAQNINPRLNYALNYSRLVSKGDYQLQKADHLSLDASLWYTSKNNQYKFWFAALSNNLTVKENGGVVNDSLFKTAPIYDPLFEPVNLSAATNHLRQTELFFKQSYAMGDVYQLKLDSISIDKVQNKHRFTQEWNYFNKVINFDANSIDSGYFAHIYIDSLKTADYTQIKKFNSLIAYEYFEQKSILKSGLKSFRFGLQNQLVAFQNNKFDSTFMSHHFISSLHFQISPAVNYLLHADYIFAGSYEKNFSLHTQLDYDLLQRRMIATVAADAILQSPVFSALQLHNNHYQWVNNFQSIQTNKFSVSIDWKPIALTLNFAYQSLGNYVYFDQTFAPIQANKLIRLNTFYIAKRMAWHALHFDNYIYLQQSSDQNILPQPKYHIYNSTYVQMPLFNAALKIRAGLDTRYYSAYRALAYSPANMTFHLGDKVLGDYPVIDVFVTAKLKRAVIMFKLEHANNLINNCGAMMVANYPIAPRTFKLGLLWNFYD